MTTPVFSHGSRDSGKPRPRRRRAAGFSDGCFLL